MQDGMQTDWPAERVSHLVKQAVQEWGISQLISFDEYGVSGHVNHISVHHGIR
jgi:N-acetylglucosaminylphosphatidylinositol deacetylase